MAQSSDSQYGSGVAKPSLVQSPVPAAEPSPDAGRSEKQPAESSPTPQMRAEACGRMIEQVLRDHGCRIVTYQQPPEAVGESGILVRAAWGIVPLAR